MPSWVRRVTPQSQDESPRRSRLHFFTMPPKKNTTGKSTPNDRVMTPTIVASAVVNHFSPKGKILEPCRGSGNIYQELLKVSDSVEWCEVDEGRDFFSYNGRVDWIITNPPYSIFPQFLKHAFSVAEDVVMIIPPAKCFASLGVLKTIKEFGGIKEVKIIGGGGKVGFPFGFPVAAVHFKRGYKDIIS